ncbi:MAG: hypothetical protein LCH88_07875 [Proteobacteria bacterium]|nr:hypothetical protein [Pseudomonadota bacterium]
MNRHLVAGAALAALSGLMPFPAAAQDLPPILRAERERLAAECRQMGGRFAPGPSYTQTADFNGDGVPDYLVDDNHNPCQGTQSIYCGSGGCSIEVYISSPTGHRRANLNFLGSPAVIRRGETPPAIALSGRGGSLVVRWDGQRFARASAAAAQRNSGTGGVAAAPAPAGDSAGAPLGAWVFTTRGQCVQPAEGVLIEPGRILIDFGGDRITYDRTALDRCNGGTCTFRQRGTSNRWSAQRLAADRISFHGPYGRNGTLRLDARREGPGCPWPR